MDIRSLLIGAGLNLIIAGIAWPWLARTDLGRLPGDIVVQRPNFSFYFPVVTCLVISLVLTLLFWLFRK